MWSKTCQYKVNLKLVLNNKAAKLSLYSFSILYDVGFNLVLQALGWIYCTVELVLSFAAYAIKLLCLSLKIMKINSKLTLLYKAFRRQILGQGNQLQPSNRSIFLNDSGKITKTYIWDPNYCGKWRNRMRMGKNVS